MGDGSHIWILLGVWIDVQVQSHALYEQAWEAGNYHIMFWSVVSEAEFSGE